MIAKAVLVMGRLYVGSIPFEQGEDVVRQVRVFEKFSAQIILFLRFQTFTPFGPIRSVNLSYDSGATKHKVMFSSYFNSLRHFGMQGFGFVEFETAESAALAIEQMQTATILGRPIKVRKCESVHHHPSKKIISRSREILFTCSNIHYRLADQTTPRKRSSRCKRCSSSLSSILESLLHQSTWR